MKSYEITKPKKGELTSKGFTKRISIKDGVTADDLLGYGFTNYNDPSLYFMKQLDRMITLNVTVDKETIAITDISVLDEYYGQPYDYQYFLRKDKEHKGAREIFDKVDEEFTKLQNDGIITGYVRGMYI